MKALQKVGIGLALTVISTCGYAKPVDIGFIGTMSTSFGYMGAGQRDAISLAIKEDGGKLGGIPVKLIAEDDGFKPGTAKQSAERMLQQGVHIFTGATFSNVVIAVAPAVTAKGAFYVSSLAGPSEYAGKNCNKNFFSVAFESNSHSDTAAMAANKLGLKKMVLLAPAYQAGRDSLAAFKGAYKGEILAEIYTKFDQSDFSVELARIRSLHPDGIFLFEPGGPGINFAKQFEISGLKKSITVVNTIGLDDRLIAGSGDATQGYYLTTQWTPMLDNQANKKFVASYEKEYNRRPTYWDAVAYDTARLIGSALKAVNGDVEGKPDQFRKALEKADFKSVRGNFKFNNNHYPISDWYLAKIVPNSKGKLDYKYISSIATNHTDPFAPSCKMKE